MAEDRDDRTQEIALDEVDAARPRSGPPPLPSRRTPSPDLEPESSDRPTDPPPKSPGASKPPVRLGKSLVPPPLAAAVAPGRAETPRSSRATVKLKPITDVPSGETRVPDVRPEPLPFAQAAEAARPADAPTTPRPSVPPPLAGGVPPRVDRSTRELRRVGPSDASAPTTTATSATVAPTPSATTPSATTPSATTPSATTPSATTPNASMPTSGARMPTSSASMPTPSATPRALAAPRPALVSRPPTERPGERTTTASLADAALQARLRHLETHVDELPKWTARIVALESDPRFAAIDTQLETLGASLASLHTKLDATVASLASLLDRTSGLERARDEGRARADRALDVATAAHEASRGLDTRERDTTERVRALEESLRALEASTSHAHDPKHASPHAHDTDSHDTDAPWVALEERLAILERASDATLRARVEAMEARLVSLVARFADIAARAPGEGSGRASLLPPAPLAPVAPLAPAPLAPETSPLPSGTELEALVRELVRRELADHVPATTQDESPRAKPKKPRRTADVDSTDADPLTTVKGVGPAFAERLRANDVTDVATLAQLDDARLEALARAVGAPIAKLRKWREAARAMI